MEYYIEYIIFQEFVVDYILLYMTGSLLSKKIIYKRLITASVLGVIYTIAVYTIPREFLNYYIVKFMVSVFLLTIALEPKGFIDYIKVIICFYILSILIMGIIILSYFIFKSRLTIVLLLLAIFIVYMLFKVLFVEMKKNIENQDYYREIDIYLNGNFVSLIGFIDTGNELIDAFSNKPVAIAYIEYIKDLFDTNTFIRIKEAYDKGSDSLINLMLEKLTDYNFRLLKYGTIKNKEEYMVGVVPNRTVVRGKEKSIGIDCIIGIYPTELSKDNKFQALLFKKILNWEGDM